MKHLAIVIVVAELQQYRTIKGPEIFE